MSNVINQVVFGRRLDYEDVDLKCLRFFEAYYVAALKALLIPGYKVGHAIIIALFLILTLCLFV